VGWPVGRVNSGFWHSCRPNATVLSWNQELGAAWNEMWLPKTKRAPAGLRLQMGTPQKGRAICTGTLRELRE
jgi:hypothetical protein